MIFLHILAFFLCLFFICVFIISRRVIKRRRESFDFGKITYGAGINKHLFRSGMIIEHGMVFSNGRLEAQSKISDSRLESMMLR